MNTMPAISSSVCSCLFSFLNSLTMSILDFGSFLSIGKSVLVVM